MEFTWKQFIELIEKTFEISQNEIAIYLGVNRSTITRLRNGTTCSPSLGNNAMYKKLFDLSNPESLARKKYTGMSPKKIADSLLYTLNRIIENEHWTVQTDKTKNSEYQNYVMELIKLARVNSSKSLSKGKIVPSENIPHEDILQETISSTSTEYVPSENTPTITGDAKFFISSKYQKCLYCEYFHIAETEHKNISNPLGTCTVHERKMRSASNACEYFEENTGKISKNMLMGNFSLDNLRL